MTTLTLTPLTSGTADPTGIGLLAAYPDAPWAYPDGIYPDENSLSALALAVLVAGSLSSSGLTGGSISLPSRPSGSLSVVGSSPSSLGALTAAGKPSLSLAAGSVGSAAGSPKTPGTLTLTPR